MLSLSDFGDKLNRIRHTGMSYLTNLNWQLLKIYNLSGFYQILHYLLDMVSNVVTPRATLKLMWNLEQYCWRRWDDLPQKPTSPARYVLHVHPEGDPGDNDKEDRRDVGLDLKWEHSPACAWYCLELNGVANCFKWDGTVWLHLLMINIIQTTNRKNSCFLLGCKKYRTNKKYQHTKKNNAKLRWF